MPALHGNSIYTGTTNNNMVVSKDQVAKFYFSLQSIDVCISDTPQHVTHTPYTSTDTRQQGDTQREAAEPAAQLITNTQEGINVFTLSSEADHRVPRTRFGTQVKGSH